MDRRIFLGTLVLGAIAAFGAGVVVGDGFYTPPVRHPRRRGAPRKHPRPMPTPFALPKRFVAPNLARIALPRGTLHGLPGEGNSIAFTVDDGNSSEVVGLYAKFAAESGMRLTFFVTGDRPSWSANAAALRPLVASGQIQLANHTWTHADLTRLSDDGIRRELTVNETFVRETFGVEMKPYYRPPFGYSNDRVRQVARSIGYSTPVMWYGSIADSGLISGDELMAYARKWLLAQHIVIGHANAITVTRHFEQLADLIRERGLVPVTLDDVFLRR